MNPDLYVAIKSEYLLAKGLHMGARGNPPPSALVTNETTPKENETAGGDPSTAMDVADVGNSNGEAAADADDNAEAAGAKRKRVDDRDNNSKTEFKKLSLKNRHNHAHQKKEDRLCGAMARGEECPFGTSCHYLHDLRQYLDQKPPDISPVCYQFITFGNCPNGFACRFGNAHIDRENLKLITRESATVRPPGINLLRKEAQFLLRKKGAYFEHLKKLKKAQENASAPVPAADSESAQSATVEATAAAAPETSTSPEAPAPVETTDAATEAGTVPTDNHPQSDSNTETVVDSTNTAPTTADVPEAPKPAAYAASASKWTKVSHFSAYFDNAHARDAPVKLVDFSNKVYVAPLTTVGNLPFRRVLKDFGADITCGEMAMAYNLQTGQSSEWALLRRHPVEDCFGIQVAANSPDLIARCAQLLEHETVSDFVDLNCGCPIDVVCQRGGGSALLNKPQKLVEMLRTMSLHLPSRAVTVKVRTGWEEKHPTTHKLIPHLQTALPAHKLACIFVHGRSRLQRYSKLANWDYVLQCAQAQDPTKHLVPIIGNGDIFSHADWASHRQLMRDNIRGEDWQGDESTLMGLTSCAMLGRGALIKPWLPQEIKEERSVDISASERLDMLQRFCNYGLEHWGSDTQGVRTTRRFLLEWLSFLHRYVPAGITEHVQKMNQRPPPYFGRGDLETLLSSPNAVDWIRISEMLLGPVDDDFSFVPKHKSNSYATPSADGGEGEATSNG